MLYRASNRGPFARRQSLLEGAVMVINDDDERFSPAALGVASRSLAKPGITVANDVPRRENHPKPCFPSLLRLPPCGERQAKLLVTSAGSIDKHGQDIRHRRRPCTATDQD